MPHDPALIEQPQEPAAAPYFTSWVTPADPQGASARVPRLLRRPEDPHDDRPARCSRPPSRRSPRSSRPAPDEPTASLVSIDNATGQVRAMVGGPLVDGHQDYEQYPFNLATLGERQPGSSFKPFTLAVALQHGYTPDSVFDSKPLNLVVPNSGGKEHLPRPQRRQRVPRTDHGRRGDRAVRQQRVHPARPVARRRHQADQPRWRRRWASTTPVSTNPAMIIGGLKVGVSPLEMAHAYETFAEGGNRVYDPVLGSPRPGPDRDRRDPVPARQVPRQAQAGRDAALKRVLPRCGRRDDPRAAARRRDLRHRASRPRSAGSTWSARPARRPTRATPGSSAGRRSSRPPSGSASPTSLVPMLTQFNGGPVTGGTFPAEIWRAYMESALQINAEEQPPKPARREHQHRRPAATRRHVRLRAGHGDDAARPTTAPAQTTAPSRRRPRHDDARRRRPPTTPAPTTAGADDPDAGSRRPRRRRRRRQRRHRRTTGGTGRRLASRRRLSRARGRDPAAARPSGCRPR